MNPTGLQLLALIVGVILPLLTGLLTKRSMSSGIKAVLLLALAAATGFGAQWLDALHNDVHYDLTAAAFTAIAVWLTGIGAHFGLLRPTGATDAVADRGVKD